MLKVESRGLRQICTSKIARDTNTAVNRLAMRPMTSVTAKPRTGPVPNTNRNALATTVVTCVSMMVTKARSNPAPMAAATALPARISSLMRSKMSTFESTAMPIESTRPAMPGSVQVASM